MVYSRITELPLNYYIYYTTSKENECILEVAAK